ncbi:MAG TPA: hypothetical protein ENK56_01295 [Chloroflexi bacterium]|nr:hypothetical protein [Chloroflexota bacterium]
MPDVPRLLVELYEEASSRRYLRPPVILDRGNSFLKARLYIGPDLFVQVYRNDRYGTTNLVLVWAGRRIYARDEVGGVWHRHPADDPSVHDTSPEGQRPVTLGEFLDEVEDLLVEMNLL